TEPRLTESGAPDVSFAQPVDTIHYGVSEKFTLILQGGAGGPLKQAGDYLYNDGVERSFKAGAWGIIRVLPGLVPALKPLPPTVPAGSFTLPSKTGGRPPAPTGADSPCPANAPLHQFNISAIDLPSSNCG